MINQSDLPGVLVFGIFILAIVFLVFFFIIVGIQDRMKHAHLNQSGQEIVAIIDEVKSSVVYEGPTPGSEEAVYRYVITAHWIDPQTGKTHQFLELVQSPHPLSGRFIVGKTVMVIIDPRKPSIYHMHP
jgi:hypothetical protein